VYLVVVGVLHAVVDPVLAWLTGHGVANDGGSGNKRIGGASSSHPCHTSDKSRFRGVIP
jgi:hypothetical protein